MTKRKKAKAKKGWHVSIYGTQEQAQRLKEVADRLDVPQQRLIREGLEYVLAKYGKKGAKR